MNKHAKTNIETKVINSTHSGLTRSSYSEHSCGLQQSQTIFPEPPSQCVPAAHLSTTHPTHTTPPPPHHPSSPHTHTHAHRHRHTHRHPFSLSLSLSVIPDVLNWSLVPQESHPHQGVGGVGGGGGGRATSVNTYDGREACGLRRRASGSGPVVDNPAVPEPPRC